MQSAEEIVILVHQHHHHHHQVFNIAIVMTNIITIIKIITIIILIKRNWEAERGKNPNPLTFSIQEMMARDKRLPQPFFSTTMQNL